ncbi:hypothetical protein CPB83DRAFT_768363, partial [Crepidotus variabilis]
EADIAAVEEAELEEQVQQDDDGQIANDESTVKSIRGDAIREMRERGVYMTTEEEKTALNILPKVSGLARRVHDITTLDERFQELVRTDQELQFTKRALARRVPTRWNSDFDCIDSHLHFKAVIQSMTGVTDLKLKAYALSEDQWDLVKDLQEVLKLFKDITLLFSQADIPLVVDVLPALFQLRDSMDLVVNDAPPPTPAVLRIAAKAASLLLDKYLNKIWECEIYTVAIVMCPDRKLQWFKDRGMPPSTIKEIKSTVLAVWKDKYAPMDNQQLADAVRGCPRHPLTPFHIGT